MLDFISFSKLEMRPIVLQFQATEPSALKRITSSLEDIEGIGSQKRKNLLVYFGGIERIKNASIEEIIMVDGIDKKLAEKFMITFIKK